MDDSINVVLLLQNLHLCDTIKVIAFRVINNIL